MELNNECIMSYICALRCVMMIHVGGYNVFLHNTHDILQTIPCQIISINQSNPLINIPIHRCRHPSHHIAFGGTKLPPLSTSVDAGSIQRCLYLLFHEVCKQ